jgi:hypothetical protein
MPQDSCDGSLVPSDRMRSGGPFVVSFRRRAAVSMMAGLLFVLVDADVDLGLETDVDLDMPKMELRPGQLRVGSWRLRALEASQALLRQAANICVVGR